MITVITFNPSIDRLYKVENFEIGSVQRANFVKPTVGGKGINVAKVLKKLDQDINCIGFLGGLNGEYIRSAIERLGINNKFTNIEKESRICINIIDRNNVSTEILEVGPYVNQNEIIEFENTLGNILDNTKVLVASGSLPKGLPANYYYKIGNLCNKKNVKFILDTSGESLKLGIKSKPYLIKPNIEELEKLADKKIINIEEIIYIAKDILKIGVKNVCVSLGKDGMILVNDNVVYRVEIPKIETINTVGSGDCCIAGFALGVLNEYDLVKTLKLANACGMSNASNISTGHINLDEVNNFIDMIKVQKVLK